MKPTRREFVGGAVGSLLVRLPVLADDQRRSQLFSVITADPGLVAYWPLDGDTSDWKGRAPLQPVGGEPEFVESSTGGKAAVLEQGRFFTAGPTPHLDLATGSLELLFRLTQPVADSYNPCLVAKRSGHRQTRFSVHVDRRTRTLDVWDGRRVFQFTPQSGPLEVGQWYHLTLTWQDGQLQVYVDGLRALGSGRLNEGQEGLPFQLGSSTPKGRELCNCQVDEVAVYNRVLSQSEIMRRVEAAGLAERSRRVLAERERLAAERRRRDAQKRQQLLNDPRLLAVGQQRVYRGQHLEAVSLPVGGIGAGCVQVNGKAELKVWQIFGNFEPVQVPHSFLAVRTRTTDGRTAVRALQTEAVGPFEPFRKLSFRGEYPFGWFDFEDELPVRVTLETFHPLIPLNAKDSAIPCALFQVKVTNRSDGPVDVSVLGSLQNAVGYDGRSPVEGRRFSGYGGNVNRVVTVSGATVLHCTRDGSQGERNVSRKDKTKVEQKTGRGELALVCFDDSATGTASWPDLQSLRADLLEDGRLSGPAQAGPSEAGQTLDGALAAAVTLEPNQSHTFRLALVWHFPEVRHGTRRGWTHRGQMYANWWPDVLAVVRYLVEHRQRLTDQTRLYHDTVYSSNLPRWLLDRMTSQAAVLSSKTCFWAADGYFGGWEGCNARGGCCGGNCGHVWHYAQLHARLFPEIARRMREQALKAQAADGGIPFRQPAGRTATDGQCGDILGAYREHLCSPDDTWLRRHWPRIKRAMEYVIRTWDADEDGVLAGPQHNTLDGELGGSSSWLGSLYLSALAASERMARHVKDEAAAERFARIRASGVQKQDQTLFNGEYYIQIPDPEPREDYNNGCHIDQVLGEWWACQLGLPRNYPLPHVRSALKALLVYNFRGDFHGVPQIPRKFVDDNDAGLQMICWPKGDRPARHMRYADEVMSGFEYSAAAAMVQAGLLKEGLLVVLAASDRYDGRLRTGLAGAGQGRAAWGYSGNPFGDDECGKFYARPMSVWSLLLALQGFLYDGPAGLIGFKPVWRPEDHRTFFTAAEGWGLFAQSRRSGRQTERLQLTYGKLRLTRLVFELPEGATLQSFHVRTSDGRQLAADAAQSETEVTLTLRRATQLTAGEALTVELVFG